MDLLDKLGKLKLKKYDEKSFRKYWMKENEFGKSRRRMIHKKSIIEVHELWRNRLICRLFYLEEGCENRQIYHRVREITRYLAGHNRKLVSGIYTGLSGVQVTPTSEHSCSPNWIEVNLYKYTPANSSYYSQNYFWITHNDCLSLIKDTQHKFSGSAYVYSKNDYPDSLFDYLSKYEKYPILEVIVKKGWKHLLRDIRYMRFSKNSLPSVLGILKQDFKYLDQGHSITFIRNNIETIRKMSSTEIQLLSEIENRSYSHLEHIDAKNMKLIKYLAKNNDVYLYNNYIRFANEIGLDLRINKIRYPKELKRAHDMAMDKIKISENKKFEEAFIARYNKLKKLSYTKFGLTIYPAREPLDLIKESRELNHCVRTYIEDVANGKSEIHLLRKEENLDTPFVTVECIKGKITQVRGKNNSVPTDEVKDFLKIWSSKNKIEYRA